MTHPLTTVDADDRVAVVASLPYYFGNSGGIAWCAGVVRDGGCAGHLAKVDSAELWWTMLPVSHFYASADLFPHTRPPGDSPATTTDDQPMQSRWFGRTIGSQAGIVTVEEQPRRTARGAASAASRK